ncbi:UbiA family prenyltransferase [Infirmifilum uzonense]|uniref:UbiA family prenyltransferase n=1 Tax=Infirmifilum uzonense TaxID=1550241 RepID=UPI00069B0AEE|nr:UbiA family prenyltransferase [Infirmifilum uzonense]
MKNLRAWFIATRPWSFVMTASSITAATVYTYFLTGILNLPFFIATLLGVTLLHASANVLNDYYDTKRGVDIPGAPTTQYRPHPLITGLTTPEKLRNFALTLLAAGLFFAFILAIYRTLIVILLALSGVFFVIGYSGLLGLKYKALGELSVFLSWGPLMWLGTYYVQTGLLDLQPVLASIPIGLLVAAVLTANNLRDIEFDKSRGATTLEVLLGREKGLRFFAYFEVYLAYMVLVVLTALRLVPLTALLPILTLPSAFRLVKMFQKEIPATADPMTAKLVQDFAIWYILGLALGLVIRF